MRKFLQSVLAFFTLGLCATGCTKSEAPPTGPPMDVTLKVPAMH